MDNMQAMVRQTIEAIRSNEDFRKRVEAAAAGGDSASQFILGLYYLNGDDDVPCDEKKAEHWLRKAAEQDPGYAVDLGRMFLYGDGVEQSDENAEKCFEAVLRDAEKIPKDVVAEAAYWLGCMVADGKVADADRERGLNLLKDAAAGGHAAAYARLGMDAEREGRDKDARKMYYRGVELGDPASMRQLGVRGLESEDEETRKAGVLLLEEAVLKGDLDAKYHLGLACLKGRGMDQDVGRAIQLLREPAEAGDPKSQFWLASAYAEQGKTEDARKWLEAAAEQGSKQALDLLKQLEKASPQKDDAASADSDMKKIFRKAEAGNADAQYVLACAYLRNQDRGRALYWLKEAAKNGHPKARSIWQEMERSMEAGRSHGNPQADLEDRAAPGRMPSSEPARAMPKSAARRQASRNMVFLKDQAKQGDPMAQYQYGRRLMETARTENNEEGEREGLGFLKEAVRQGHADAMAYYGSKIADIDALRAEQMFLHAKKKNSILGTFYYGRLLHERAINQQDFADGYKMIMEAVLANEPEAIYYYATKIRKDGKHKTAIGRDIYIDFLTEAANPTTGFPVPDAQYDLAKELGDDSDWLEKAADNMHPRALVEMGGKYESINKKEDALGFYKRAADIGDSEGRYRYGMLLLSMEGKGSSKGWNAVKEAAARGHRDAQFEFGRHCEERNDMREAAIWLARAANQGHEEAARKLYNLY